MTDKLSLTDELQTAHKLVSMHNEMMETLFSKCEHYLLPSSPSVVKAEDAPSLKEGCAVRAEIRHIVERMSRENDRLRDFIIRLDV